MKMIKDVSQINFVETIINLSLDSCTTLCQFKSSDQLQRLILPSMKADIQFVTLPDGLLKLRMDKYIVPFVKCPARLQILILPSCRKFNAIFPASLTELHLKTYPDNLPDHVKTIREFNLNVKTLSAFTSLI